MQNNFFFVEMLKLNTSYLVDNFFVYRKQFFLYYYGGTGYIISFLYIIVFRPSGITCIAIIAGCAVPPYYATGLLQRTIRIYQLGTYQAGTFIV